MQNTSFLALFRPIFAQKTKILAPSALAMRIGQGPDMTSTRKLGFPLAEDLFFFWRSPKFRQKNRLNLSKDRPKSDTRSFAIVSSLPIANSWLHAWLRLGPEMEVRTQTSRPRSRPRTRKKSKA